MSTTDVLTHMAQQHAWGWTAGQIARWHSVERGEVEQLIAQGFPSHALPSCAGCDKPFMPANPSNRYCSKRCQRRAANRRAAERERTAATPRTCATCGTTFQPIGNQRYCSQACRPQSQTIGQPKTRQCAQCGQEFVPVRTDRGRGFYCGAECRNDANRYTVAPGKAEKRNRETAAIVPSETKPARTKPMTDAEFERELALIRRQLTERGIPLTRLDGIAVQEKPERIAAAMERERQAA